MIRAWCVGALLALMACSQTEPDPDAQADQLRVVTLAPHLAELVVSAGGAAMLVGVSAYSDYPVEVTALPVVSDGFRIDAEALLAVRPTLVLAWGGGGQAASRALLDELGITTLEVPGRSLADIPTALRMIGAALETSTHAETAARQFEADIAALRFADGQLLDVFYQIGSRPLYTVGGGHFISELVALCGGRNIFADIATGAPVVSIEAVVLRDPDVILHAAGDGDAPSLWQRWPAMQAVRANTIMAVPGDLIGRPSTRLASGGAAVCAALATARERLGQDSR